LETAWAGTARNEVDDAVALLDTGLMRVPGDNESEPLFFGSKRQRLAIMYHVDRLVEQRQVQRLWIDHRPLIDIDVPPDRRDRRYLPQMLDDLRVADIACVDDVVDTAQQANGLFAQEAVGI